MLLSIYVYALESSHAEYTEYTRQPEDNSAPEWLPKWVIVKIHLLEEPLTSVPPGLTVCERAALGCFV